KSHENRTRDFQEIQGVRDSTFTTSLLHPFMAGRWALPPAAPRSMPAKISKISSSFSKKTTSIGKYGKYTCVFPEENAYFPREKVSHAPLENINPVFSRTKSSSRRTPPWKIWKI